MEERFIKTCIDAIENRHPNDLSSAADIISKAAEKLPRHIHPMIQAITWLAQDISELHQSEDERLRDWEALGRIIYAYDQNNWYATMWTFSAVYSDVRDGRILSGIGINVTRKHGQLTIETSADTLRHAIEKTAATLNPDQTDEWFIHNLARALPKVVQDMTLTDTYVSEAMIAS